MPDAASVQSLCEAGLAAYQKGTFELAAAYFADAVRLDPHQLAAWANLGNALGSAGDPEAAAGAYGHAIAIDPSSAETYYNLGAVLRRAGDPVRAAFAYAEAVSLGLETAEAFNNLGLALADDGRLDEAIAAYGRALALAQGDPGILVNLGNALGECARPAEAIRAYEAALARDPEHVQAHYNLFAALFDDAEPGPAEQHLHRVLARDPEHAGALFHIGALAALRERRAAAARYLERLPAAAAHLVSSLDHILAHRTARTRLFTDGFRLLEHGLSAAARDGLVLELGVRRGASIRFLAARTAGTVHGFDSFEGLPEAWRGVPEGAYSTQRELPEVPANVRLHAGWFTDTLSPFVAGHPGPIRFLNVDCDLYSSTRDALAVLGPRLQTGSVVVFDEYLCNPGWEEDEHRALVEAARALGFSYEYIAFGLFSKQAAIVVR